MSKDAEGDVIRHDPPEGCKLEAHDSGDGWVLTATKKGEVVAYLDWPDTWPEQVTERQLKGFGFEVV